MHRHDLTPVGKQRLVDGEEVPHRWLRRGHGLLRRPQPLVELVEVGDLRLALLLALEPDVEADQRDVVSSSSAGGTPEVVSATTVVRVEALTTSVLPSPPMAKTLVTGGTGFIGSHVVSELARRGDELRLLVREGRDVGHLDGFEWERATGDVCDRDSVRRAMKGVDRVFHVAGKTSMRSGERKRVFEINVEGTRNVMEEALRAGVIRAVHTSSAGPSAPRNPAAPPTSPSRSPRAASGSPTSTPSTTPRPPPFASPPRACRS